MVTHLPMKTVGHFNEVQNKRQGRQVENSLLVRLHCLSPRVSERNRRQGRKGVTATDTNVKTLTNSDINVGSFTRKGRKLYQVPRSIVT